MEQELEEQLLHPAKSSCYVVRLLIFITKGSTYFLNICIMWLVSMHLERCDIRPGAYNSTYIFQKIYKNEEFES